MGTQLSSPPPKGVQPPIFGPCLLWPNGWMYQDATWYGGKLQPRPIVLDGDPTPILQKGAQPPPIFGPCLLWPNDRPSQLPLSSCSSSHVRRHLHAVSSWALGKLHWTDVVMVMTLHVGWLEFNVPFQHKYGYIRDEITLQSQRKGNFAV